MAICRRFTGLTDACRDLDDRVAMAKAWDIPMTLSNRRKPLPSKGIRLSRPNGPLREKCHVTKWRVSPLSTIRRLRNGSPRPPCSTGHATPAQPLVRPGGDPNGAVAADHARRPSRVRARISSRLPRPRPQAQRRPPRERFTSFWVSRVATTYIIRYRKRIGGGPTSAALTKVVEL